MLMFAIAAGLLALIVLAAIADRRSKALRRRLGDDRFEDGVTAVAGGTNALTRSRRSAANNGGAGMPGSTLGTGE